MKLKEEIDRKTQEIESILEKYLPEEQGFSETMARAVNYSMKAGGKRLRPMLMQESFLLFGGKGEVICPFMAAIEMIHTHSLIHDDLPALDNDEYRRGKQTTHVLFGEAMGILSGDALLNAAYETAFEAFDVKGADLPAVAKALQVLAAKTGIRGMLGGQGVDVEMEGKALDLAALNYIYENKTAALIEASLMTGALLAGAGEAKAALMEKVGQKVGLAFQIQDDILDVTSTLEELGKPIHSDEKNAKTTYVTLKGIRESRELEERLSQEALELLDSLREKNDFLRQLILSLITRKK